MKIYALNHVQIAMPEGEENPVRAFYGVLGCSEQTKPDQLANRGGIWLTLTIVLSCWHQKQMIESGETIVTMHVELDHLFICTSINAPEAERLISFGLTEGRSNVHQGQGTTNRCFFFHNLMLELLWVHNPAETQSEPIQPLHLWERWVDRDSKTCPFGLCLRPSATALAQPHKTRIEELPFTTWEYHPPYIQASQSIPVATNANIITEPILFYLDWHSVPDSQPLDHPVGLREVTDVEFISPYANSPSLELQGMVNANLLKLSWGSEYLLKLGFDRQSKGQQIDFRPILPLIFSF
jgi:Glyoxalase-like domain